MIRTIISLDESDKNWLDQQAAMRHQPMTEVVREAIRLFRATHASDGGEVDELLANTSGCWPHGDGLNWQRDQRDEWTR